MTVSLFYILLDGNVGSFDYTASDGRIIGEK
jgi:hypothetical protein